MNSLARFVHQPPTGVPNLTRSGATSRLVVADCSDAQAPRGFWPQARKNGSLEAQAVAQWRWQDSTNSGEAPGRWMVERGG